MRNVKTKKVPYAALRAKMLELGIDQENLGRLLGVNKATANKKLNKKIEFTRNDISRIMKFFQLSPEDVVTIFFKNE